MSVKNNFQVILVMCTALLISCSEIEGSETSPNDKKGKMKITTLSSLDSGYKLNASHWINFIKCWSNKYNNTPHEEISLISLSSKDLVANYQYDKTFVEDYLKFKLTDSLDHFYESYVRLNGKFISISDDKSVGFYFPTELKSLIDFDSEMANVDPQWLIESPDEKYYQYGIKQDTSTGRNSYLKGALVIGKYGHSSNELILLYPNSKTKDGEMEASILSYASEFRTPSFAEMMRQISLIGTEDLLPPYSQEKVNLGCGKYLPLENVWWK